MVPRHLPPVVVPGSLRVQPQPVLEADGLVLRPFELGDAPFVVEGFRDPAIVRWHLRTMESEEEAREWIADINTRWAEESGASWAIVADGRPAGRVGLTRLVLDEGRAEVAYWVLPSERGQRIGARATAAVAAWAFDVVGIHRIDLRHSTQNPASCAVALASGFAVEGTARSALRHEDGWHDMHLHARLVTDD